jgi:hypothetical protein
MKNFLISLFIVLFAGMLISCRNLQAVYAQESALPYSDDLTVQVVTYDDTYDATLFAGYPRYRLANYWYYYIDGYYYVHYMHYKHFRAYYHNNLRHYHFYHNSHLTNKHNHYKNGGRHPAKVNQNRTSVPKQKVREIQQQSRQKQSYNGRSSSSYRPTKPTPQRSSGRSSNNNRSSSRGGK